MESSLAQVMLQLGNASSGSTPFTASKRASWISSARMHPAHLIQAGSSDAFVQNRTGVEAT